MNRIATLNFAAMRASFLFAILALAGAALAQPTSDCFAFCHRSAAHFWFRPPLRSSSAIAGAASLPSSLNRRAPAALLDQKGPDPIS